MNIKNNIFPVENTQLKVGDLILIKSGEQVPIDCKILWGDAQVNEAIITGESIPVHKYAKDKLIGGSILNDGTVKAQVTAVGNDTVLSGIINMVKQAQGEKPPVQQLADKISAIFVPVVIGNCCIDTCSQLDRFKRFYSGIDEKYCSTGYCLSLCYGTGNSCCHCSWIGQWQPEMEFFFAMPPALKHLKI